MTWLLMVFWLGHAASDQGEILSTYHGVFGPIVLFGVVSPSRHAHPFLGHVDLIISALLLYSVCDHVSTMYSVRIWFSIIASQLLSYLGYRSRNGRLSTLCIVLRHHPVSISLR
jgi:hypothetical protein